MNFEESIPFRIDDYEIGKRLGVGGFGQVFEATHTTLGRTVALKVLHAHRCHDPEAVARFLAEARAANQIEHPGIVKVEGFGLLSDGRQYIVMELVEGRSLRTLIDKGAMAVDAALPLLRNIAAAVDAAHAVGIAHRDLKPENVIVLADGSIRLIDFGLAKLTADSTITQTGVVLGSPKYMSPEQCRGRGGTVRSDLYSFGALAYHVLTGSPPFVGDALALALQHVNEKPIPPSQRNPLLAAAVDQTIAQLLDKDPAKRPQPLVVAVDALSSTAPRRRSHRVPLVLGISALALSVPGALLLTHHEKLPTAAAPAVVPALPPTPTVRGHITKLSLSAEPAMPPWMSADGKSFIYTTQKGTFKFENDTSTKLSDEPTYRSQFPDGRWLVSHEGAKPEIWIEDPRTGSKSLFSPGRYGEVCPTGKRVGIFRDNHLRYLDLDRDRVVSMFDAGFMGSDIIARWQPSCAESIVWGGGGQTDPNGPGLGAMYLRHHAPPRARFGINPLPTTPGAFIRNDTLVYCDFGGAIRLEQLGATPDVEIGRALPMSTCNVAAAGNGGVAIVASSRMSRRVVNLDPASGASAPITSAETWQFSTAFLDENTVISAVLEPGISEWDIPQGATKQVATKRRLFRTELATGAQTEIPSCAGEISSVVQHGKLLHVVREDAKFEFLADKTCTVVASFPIPKAEDWSNPACSESVCVAAAHSGANITAYRLEPTGATSLGTVARTSVYPNPIIALSPDGTTAVATINGDISVHVFDVAKRGPIRTITVNAKDPAMTFIQSLAWGRGSKFYMAGLHLDDQPGGGVFEVSLDGTRRLIKNTANVQTLNAVSPAGTLTGALQTTESAWYRVNLDP